MNKDINKHECEFHRLWKITIFFLGINNTNINKISQSPQKFGVRVLR